MMKILALDPGNKTGWAHSNGLCGTWDLTPKRDESSGMRLIKLRSKLNEIFFADRFDLLVYESAAFNRHGMATRVADEIRGTLQVWAEDHQVDYYGYKPKEVKKHATGKGQASKELMLEKAKSLLGYDGYDVDTADALWILHLASEDYNGNSNVRHDDGGGSSE